MKSNIVKTIKEQFQEQFNQQPLMIFSPGRINLIGEHTDYNQGFVFPAAIDKGIYLGITQSESNTSSIIALDANETLTFSITDSLESVENGGWKNYIIGVLEEVKKIKQLPNNVNIAFGGDIPMGSGLSSSAALENAVVFGLNQLFNLQLSKKEIIHISQKAEHNYVGVKCGIMDQFASMFGEENSALLLDCKTLESETFTINFKEHQILLINTNVSHNLADSAYNKRRASCERVARGLKKESLREVPLDYLIKKKSLFTTEDFTKACFIIHENKRVVEASEAIQNNDLNRLGELLYQSHEGLSNQYEVSGDELDFLVDFTKEKETVLGARMMGGGFGGCTIILIRKDAVETFSEEISKAYKNQFQTYFSKHKSSLLKDYLEQELKLNERIIFQNEGFVVLVPFWAIWPYEAMIIPKKHQQHINQISKEEANQFAEAMSQLTKAYDKIFNCSFPYSSGIHQAPTNSENQNHWHWHMSFYPPLLRSATVKKFMVGYEMFGMPQRDITAEKAAEILHDLI